MDAKSNADFINSVAAGNTIPCPKCGAANKGGGRFCTTCGTQLIVPQTQPQTQPQQQVKVEKKDATPAGSSSEVAFPTITDEKNTSGKTTSADAKNPVKTAQSNGKKTKENKPEAPAFKYVEPSSVFAEGLPEWSVEPPHIMVRRH